MSFRKLFRLSHPLQLVLASMTYLLGAGIARYLGRAIHPAGFGLGWLAALALLATAYWLTEYFRLPMTPLDKNETPRNREAFRTALLQSSFAALTVVAAVAVTLILTHLLPGSAALVIFLIVLAFVLFAVPPFRLSESGYGELALAVTLGTLYPAWGFLLQYHDFHRLLPFVSFPLTLLALAYFLVCDFPAFGQDQKFGRQSLLTRLTWQYAVPVHHVLVLTAFVLFAVSPSLGYPWRLAWPVFLAAPFALAQIIWLQRIAGGGRTLWNLFTGLAAASFGLTVYLLAFTFWTH
ncbi:MAG TPA: hypothetical protein VMC09_14490 [Anaerolineales bacterium]|nr:hypothetical protein [Anaerolineales bacterium]